MNSFRFDLTKAKLRAAEIEQKARAGWMPTPAEVVFLCEIVRDLVNVSLAQDKMINTVESDLETLVEITNPKLN